MSEIYYNFERSDLSNFDHITKSIGLPTVAFNISTFPGVYVAGGYLIETFNKKYVSNDIDVYFTNVDSINQARKELNKFGYRKIISPRGCENWARESLQTIQLIVSKTYEDPCHIIDGFDLRCCQLAYTKGVLYYNKGTLWDLEKGELNIWRPDQIKKERILKYINKGFKLTPETRKIINEKGIDIHIGTEVTPELYSIKTQVKRKIKWNAQI